MDPQKRLEKYVKNKEYLAAIKRIRKCKKDDEYAEWAAYAILSDAQAHQYADLDDVVNNMLSKCIFLQGLENIVDKPSSPLRQYFVAEWICDDLVGILGYY